MNCSKFDIAIYNRYLCLVTDVFEGELNLVNLFELHYIDREPTPAGKLFVVLELDIHDPDSDIRIIGNIGLKPDCSVELAIERSQEHFGNLMMALPSTSCLELQANSIAKQEDGALILIKEVSESFGIFDTRTVTGVVLENHFSVKNGMFELLHKKGDEYIDGFGTSVLFFPKNVHSAEYEFSLLTNILNKIKENFIEFK